MGAREGTSQSAMAKTGTAAVLAPADGVFYRRPRPSDPPYTEPGARISRGQTIALIEAMKCFSAIIYEGTGLPDPAEVVEIRGNDGDEVRHGQVLFVVKSMSKRVTSPITEVIAASKSPLTLAMRSRS